MKRLVFLQMKEEAEIYKKKGRINRSDVYIALNPPTRSNLKIMGLAAEDTVDYFGTDSHKAALERSKEAVDWIRRSIELKDPYLGIKESYVDALVFWSRAAIHYLIWSTEIVLNAIDKHRPDVIVSCVSGARRSPSIFIEPEEKMFGSIARSVAETRGIRFEDIGPAGPSRLSYQIPLKFYPRSFVELLIKMVRCDLWTRSLTSKSGSEAVKTIFFNSRFYHMDALASGLAKKGEAIRQRLLIGAVVPSFKVSGLATRLICGRHSSTVLDLKKKLDSFTIDVAEAKGTFQFKGIVFSGLIANKIRMRIADHVLGLAIWSSRLRRIMDLSNPSVFISNGTRDDDTMIAEMCAARGIRTILISHGSHVPPKNEYEKIEWGEHGKMLVRAPFSSIAMQTPMAEKFHEAFPTASAKIKTGPLIWGMASQNADKKTILNKLFGGVIDPNTKNIVVHAGTPKPTKFLRFCVYETPDEYIRGLNDAAAAVENLPDTVLIIRFRPFSELRARDIKTLVRLSDKVILSTEGKFSDILSISDLLISFSSTTIEEALQNAVPVLLYGGSGRYQHIEGYAIKYGDRARPSAVYHARTPRDLGYAIKAILDITAGGGIATNAFDPFVYKDADRASLAYVITGRDG